MTDPRVPGRANIIGTGLIGGSIGRALRAQGWQVTGTDATAASAERALELGAIDAIGLDPTAAITFVAAPVRAIAGEVRRALAETAGVVTDVGSVKASLVAEIDDPRFVAVALSELAGEGRIGEATSYAAHAGLALPFLQRCAPDQLRAALLPDLVEGARIATVVLGDVTALRGALERRLDMVERRVLATPMPLSRSDLLYNLRQHLDLVRVRLSGPQPPGAGGEDRAG